MNTFLELLNVPGHPNDVMTSEELVSGLNNMTTDGMGGAWLMSDAEATAAREAEIELMYEERVANAAFKARQRMNRTKVAA